MKIAVAVTGIKRFNWHSDQKLALPSMANPLAFGCMTHALALMKWMRYVVRKRALLKQPLAVGSKRGNGCEQERDQYFSVHKLCLELHRNR